MDDRSFDALVKSLAQRRDRRSAMKGLLGVGAAAMAAVTFGRETDAARRTTPTSTPVRCPGNQVAINGRCTCPGSLQTCGSDCCNSTVAWFDPGYSECCDGACCQGLCIGEELCCPAAAVCSGGSGSADLCCDAGTFCCGGGTAANACLPLDLESACCEGALIDPFTQVCCNGVALTGMCCDDADCDGAPCCGTTCCQPGAICCEGNSCLDPNSSVTCCGGTILRPEDGGLCCDDVIVQGNCCDDDTCGIAPCCDNVCCPKYHSCCGGVCIILYPNLECCGSGVYDIETQVCCDGQPVEGMTC